MKNNEEISRHGGPSICFNWGSQSIRACDQLITRNRTEFSRWRLESKQVLYFYVTHLDVYRC